MGVELQTELGVNEADIDLLLRHYAVVGPLLERIVGAIPFVWSTLPAGVNGPTIFHGPLSEHTKPKAPVIEVPTASGVHRYPALSTARIEGLVRHGAIEVYSWSPTVADPTRVRYGRILLETGTRRRWLDLGTSLDLVEDVLSGAGVESLRVYDGGNGAALWIPFCDAPDYDDVRMWLHVLCAQAVLREPDLLTLEPNSHGGPPVHLHVQSNAVGRFSVLPYSVRAGPGYPIAMPIDVDALDDENGEDYPFVNGRVHVENFATWIEDYEDPFSTRPASFFAQRFEGRLGRRKAFTVRTMTSQRMPGQKSHGPIVSAAITVLQDGRSHSAEEIAKLVSERGLLDAATAKYVYTSLIEYIARANGNGRKPAIVQNADRTFRVNEPPDDWPELEDTPPAERPAKVAALVERLHGDSEPAAFEEAVCDAFEALGFAATHDGREKAPDGYADALLGPLGYRTMIECKSGDEGVNDPSVFEAAKFRDAYGAQYCALVGRAFSGEIELVKELHNHGVSAWTVDDLETLLRIGADAVEMRPLFAPGFASDALDDLLWERHHGRAKRVRLIADAIVRTGRTTQAGYRGAPSEAPRITEDVAMVLVDQDLAAQGSSASCSREDVRAAFDYLASPLVRLIERDPVDGSVVVLRITS